MQEFINEAFTKAVNDYLATKDNGNGIVFNSFLVVFIRLLINIYSELDVINPFTMKSVESLRSNLSKYGYSEININKLLANLQMYYNIEKTNSNIEIKQANPYFVDIQKQLVDMFILKKLNYELSDAEISEFYDLLYTPNTKDPIRLSYNYLTAKDVNEIDVYYQKQMKENVRVAISKPKNLLNNKAYELMGLNIEDINMMSAEELEKTNHQVYDYFKIRENAINKEFLLEKAIEEMERERNKVTSGNGYVDILLVMGIITTIAMVGLVVKILLF